MREVVNVQMQSDRPVLRLRVWAEVAGLALMLLEMTWITAYYTGFAHGRLAWGRVAFVLGMMMLFSHYLARVLNFFRVKIRTRQVIFGVWLLLAIFGSMRVLVFANQTPSLWTLLTRPFIAINEPDGGIVEFGHLALVTILALRGVALARDRVSSIQALRSFQIGLLAFLAYGFMLSRFGETQAYEALFAFLFFSVLAMAAARISGVSELRGGKAGRFAADWMAGIVAASLATAGAALLLGILLRGPVGFLVEQITIIVLVIFGVATMIVTYPLMLLLAWATPFLQGLFANLQLLSVLEELQGMLEGVTEKQSDLLEGLGKALDAGQILGRIGLIILILLAILAALRWRQLLHRETGEEQVSDLKATFRLPRFNLDLGKELERFRPGRWLAAARIRRIYAELMLLCARLKQPRPAAQTPLEFLPRMKVLFPEQETELETITQAYLGVRYGMLPETPEELQAVDRAWERVKLAGRRLLTSRTEKA